ncbi:MAG: tetratricopeptide repeat protein [Simkania sp.]|nr:tetratricopeptide repeat protein [Simkania sp.]
MGHLEKSKEDFIVMAEAGFIAINQGDEDAALKLFRAAQLINPANSLPKIGLGYLHFLKLELNQARKIFEEVLQKEPNNDMAKALLGLSTALSPNDAVKGEKILEDASSKTNDPAVKSMTKTAIDFIEKFVKKKPAPISAGSSKEPKKK